MKLFSLAILITISFFGCSRQNKYDIVIRNGRIIDGSGTAMFEGDIAINADTIAKIGNLGKETGKYEIDAKGLVIAPGFINMLSWSYESLIEDGKSQSEIRQGVTLEVLGEQFSFGPLNEKMKKKLKADQADVKYDVEWNTLGQYLEYLQEKGVSANIASFVAEENLRIAFIGYENREPTIAELDSMKALLSRTMEEGALGLSSALEYVPGIFAKTDELIELCKVVAQYDGMYISHIRNEGGEILSSIDEVIAIAKEARIRAEIYHLKQAGKENWNKYDAVVQKIDSARSVGLNITADMYNYSACATGLNIIMPTWVQEGGYDAWVKRLREPSTRKKVKQEINQKIIETLGTSANILLTGFKNDSLKYLTGKTIEEVARIRKTSPEETIMDLVIENGIDVDAVYFNMSEENVKKQVALPWMSFCSDAQSKAPEGVFLKSSTHPRAYGSFARLLAKYVRDEKVISLEEAIRKLTSLPASNLKIKKRGILKPGYYADLAIFDPEKIQDHATFEKPQQYATGMVYVFVNGVQVLKNGEHTGAKPGKIVRGPGWKRNN